MELTDKVCLKFLYVRIFQAESTGVVILHGLNSALEVKLIHWSRICT